MPRAVSRCLFCEKPIEPLQPIMFTMLAPAPGAQSINVPLHVVCFVEAMASQTARAVIEAIQEGRVTVGLDGDDRLPLADVVSGIVARLIKRG